jgi:DNA-binding CsgD family transcriptional regulator
LTLAAQATGQLAQDGSRTLFGRPSPNAETQRTTTIPDAVRRARWIAVDVNAESFGLFFAAPSPERPLLLPCFDSRYPEIASETIHVAGEDRAGLVRHIRTSSVPLWWADDEAAASPACFGRLAWAARTEVLVPETAGIAFPVQTDRGRCGLAIFLGFELALTPDALFDIHARCFSLFEGVCRIRPGESARFPSISKRELECLKLTANGYTSDEIARLLKLSVHTANQYLTNTAQKLDAVNRMHAVAKALRLGLIE